MRDTVDHVVFIWNNLETDPPPVPPGVQLIRVNRNDMMNRYTLTRDFPHTNSILTVDDDVIFSQGLLRCMLNQLLAHNTSIVGLDARSVAPGTGAKGLGVLHHLPFFRQFFHFHKNLSSSVISGTFSRENRFPPKPKKRPKIAKHTKHEPLPKRDAISLKFP